jgi:hypothetical protein
LHFLLASLQLSRDWSSSLKRLVTFLAVLMCAIGFAPSSGSSQSPAPAALPPVTLSVPSGSQLAFVFLRPEFAKSARAGDLIYMQTSYPVIVANQVAIPAGSFLQGSLHSLTKPTRKSSHALLTIDFQKLILPNGYSVLLNEQQTLNMQVSYASDLVLDNGTQAEISLVSPIKLNAAHVAASLALAKAPRAETMHSATRCLPTPATEGSPGMPGTPDTVIQETPARLTRSFLAQAVGPIPSSRAYQPRPLR